MRTLNTGDAFKVLQIFRAAGLKDEFAKLLDMSFAKTKKETLGGQLFALIFDCLGHEKAEPLVIKLLADIAESEPGAIANQPIKDTVSLIKQIAKENDIGSFFTDAADLT